jgi:hypothetical protein
MEENDPAYPGGKAIPSPGGRSVAGTPWRASWFNTILGFFQALIVEARGSFIVSGNPDKVGESDLLNSLKKIIENMYSDDIEEIQSVLPYLIPEGPNDGHLYGRKNKNWSEIIIPPVAKNDTLESLKLFSKKSLMITNAETVSRRLKRWDIGLPYISPASEVYHFDTDFKNQNQGSSITLTYIAAPAFVDATVSNGQIYLSPAVLDLPPYEPLGKSILGRFTLSTKIPDTNATAEFWIRLKTVPNTCVFRLKGFMGEELVLVTGGTDPAYSAAAGGDIAYTLAGDDIPYSVPATTQNRIEHNSPKGKQTTNTGSIGANSWVHIAVIATDSQLSLLIGTSKIDFPKHFQKMEDFDFILNEDRVEINLDELNIDRTVAITAAAFNQNTALFLPYGALDYTQKWGVLMFDNPNRIVTNLFESEQFKMAVLAAIHNSR